MGRYKKGNEPKRKNEKWTGRYEVEYIKDGKEYFRDPDGRLVSRPIDDTIGYRTDELMPELQEFLDRARSEKQRYPSRAMIDNLIEVQKTKPLKACNYVRYILLGELRHVDVFGEVAEEKYAAQQHYRETEEMKRAIEEMAKQIEDMQKLLFNIAVQLNGSGNSFLKMVG